MSPALAISIPSLTKIHDPQPWGKAFTYSLTIHGLLALLMIISVGRQKPETKTVLTEVKFIEAKVPAPVAETMTTTTRVEEPTKVPGTGTRLGSEGGSGPIRSHKGMPRSPGNVSSEHGTPDGVAVTNVEMSGPIVSLDQFGMVGKKKGALMPYAGETDGRRGTGASMPMGNDDKKNSAQLVLAKESSSDIRRAEASLGTPLFSEKVVSDKMDSRLKQLADTKLGERKKMSAMDLKANPADKDKWGNNKGPFSLEGPLKYRKILKMDLPPYPRWAEEKGIEASVSIRLWVDASGRVKDNMYLEKTSGYSELDFLAKSSLAKFKFVPIPSDMPQDDEWGVATFRFELKK